MRRVVVTGMGIISSIGNDIDSVTAALFHSRSGIRFDEQHKTHRFRSHVSGALDIDWREHIDRRRARFMGQAAAYAYLAFEQACADSGLALTDINNPRCGIVCGSGGGSNENIVESADIVREGRGAKRVGPYRVTRAMGNTTSAIVGTFFGLQGVSYSISSACATSAHCIGNAYELIQYGKQDVVFAGGGEELHWSMSVNFDAMGALSSKFNDTPTRASRAYDADRDGFVISGGGGIVVLEEYERAKARGAPIYAEVVGYGATSDGFDMVAPSGEGAARCMQSARHTVDTPIDYINVHGTGTQVGDLAELDAIRSEFGNAIPPISSTKSLTGHALGAAGVNEAIYTLLMLKNDFICKSAHIDTLDPKATDFPIVRSRIDNAGLTTVMSNSFGFGGTNATLVFRRI